LAVKNPTDNRIIECAAASGSEYLVSGDKHLLKIGQWQGVSIIPPADVTQNPKTNLAEFSEGTLKTSMSVLGTEFGLL